MNLQIFGTKKDFDTKKAQRFFKERGVKFQFIELAEKSMSKGEFNSICSAVGGFDKVVYIDSDIYNEIKYYDDNIRIEKLLKRPELLRLPIVRDGKRATVGVCEAVWKEWLAQK